MSRHDTLDPGAAKEPNGSRSPASSGPFRAYIGGGEVHQGFCTFTLAERWYGIPVHCVREVLQQQEITPVPLGPPELRGLINLRGQIVTVIDLRRRLHLPDADSPIHVIVEHGGEFVSFLVDTVGDVRELNAEQFELPPGTLRGPARDLIVGTYRMAEALLTLLDVAHIANIRSTLKS